MRVGAIGYYLPEEMVTNEVLLSKVAAGSGPGVDLEKLERKLMLNKAEARYFIKPEESALDMAEKAARCCLERSGSKAEEIDLLLYTAMKREYVEPSMSVLLQDRLGARANTFDISNACLGFLNAMELAKLYIDSGKYQKILVISAETGSEWIPWEKFTGESELAGFSALTVSDAAVAMLLEEGGDEKNFGLFEFKTLGEYNDLCQIKIGKGGDDLKLLVKSRQLAMTAMEVISEFTPRFLHKAIEYLGCIDIWFPHQVTGNPKRFFGVEDELYSICYNTFSKVGNTGSVSIPLGMVLAEEEGLLKRGDKVALIVGASGFSYGGACFIY